MKIEKRGKFPGIKLHLDEDEIILLISPDPSRIIKRILKRVKEALAEDFTILHERTEEEVIKELQVEFDKSQRKLQAIAAGANWRDVK